MTSEDISQVVRQISGRLWRLGYVLHPRTVAWDWIRKHRPNTPVITHLKGGMRVRIYPVSFSSKPIYVHGVCEQLESRFVIRYLKCGMVFFDVGANLGQYTLLAAQKVGTEGQVHSFEPSGQMFAELSFNVELNGITDRCSLNRVALSDRIGAATLTRHGPGAEMLGSLGDHRRDEAPIVGYEKVETTTLDSYVQQRDIRHIDLIKMDIEGAELLALKGANQILARPDAPPIILEMADVTTASFGYRALDIWNYLTSVGYAFYGLSTFSSRLKPLRQPPSFEGVGMNLVAMKRIAP